MGIGPAGFRPPGQPRHSGQVKGWVRERFGLGEETPVMVTELRCTEPGCPPVETAIAILEAPGDRRRYKIHKPVSEVVPEDVAGLVDERDLG